MADSPAPTLPPVNGHAERSAATRRKLICATIATLNAVGYPATTTIEVVRRAKVSRGAMLHHFGTRAELLLATAEHVLREQEAERRDTLRDMERGEERFFAVTDVMWNTMQRPEATALTEIMLGARSDPEIHGPFAKLMREFNRKLLDGPNLIAEDHGYADTRLVRAMARLHVAAMRGLVVQGPADAAARRPRLQGCGAGSSAPDAVQHDRLKHRCHSRVTKRGKIHIHR